MARPKIDPAERRTEQVSLALSPIEFGNLKAKANQADTTVTAFVRAAALGQRVSVTKSTAPDFVTRDEYGGLG